MLRLLYRFFRLHFFYGIAIVLSLLCALLLALCILFLPQKPVEYPAPSGHYRVSAILDKDTSRLRLILRDSTGQQISTLRTQASHFAKWALGWMPAADIIVLYSGESGTLAYTITREGKMTSSRVTPPIDQRARELKKEKYQ